MVEAACGYKMGARGVSRTVGVSEEGSGVEPCSLRC